MTDPKMEAFEKALLNVMLFAAADGAQSGSARECRATVLRLYEEAVKDAARLDWMQEHFVGADFDYGAEPNESCCVLLIEIPHTAKVGAELRKSLDAAVATDAPITEDGNE